MEYIIDGSIIYLEESVIEKKAPIIKDSDTVLKKREANRLAAKRHRERRANILQGLTDEKATLQESITTLKTEQTRLNTDLEILKMKLNLMYGYITPISCTEQSTTEPNHVERIQWSSTYWWVTHCRCCIRSSWTSTRHEINTRVFKIFKLFQARDD